MRARAMTMLLAGAVACSDRAALVGLPEETPVERVPEWTADASIPAPDAGRSDAGGEPDAGPPRYPSGAVGVENWYPTRGGSTVAMAWFWAAPMLLRRAEPDLEDCLAFPAGRDPWAPERACNSPCGAGEYCGADGACHVWGAYQSAGRIGIAGGSPDIALEFRGPPPCQTLGCYERVTPGPRSFDGGELARFTAAGDAVPGFSASIAVPPSLEVIRPELKVFPRYTPVDAGAPLRLEWVAHGGDGELQIEFFSLYGGAVLCRARDDGEFVVEGRHLAVLPRNTNELEGFFTRRRALLLDTDAGLIEVYAGSVESGTFLIRP